MCGVICSPRVVVISPLAMPHPNTADCATDRADLVADGLHTGIEAAHGGVAEHEHPQAGGRRRRRAGGPSLRASSTASAVSLGTGSPQNSGSPNDQMKLTFGTGKVTARVIAACRRTRFAQRDAGNLNCGVFVPLR